MSTVIVEPTETRVGLAVTTTGVELAVTEDRVLLETQGPAITYTTSMADFGYIDVTDYLAAGDGVQDDTAEIQAAITSITQDSSLTTLYAALGKGGTLYLPPGEFLVSSELELTRFVNIIGAGKDRTILKAAADSITVLRVSRHSQNTAVSHDYQNNRRATIRGLTVDGNGHTGVTGIAFGRGSQWTNEDLNVTGCDIGLLFEETQNVTSIDVSAQSNNTNLVLDRGAAGLSFINCEFSGALTGYNLHVKGTSGYNSSTATASDTPVSQCLFDNCRFELEGGASTLGMVYIAAGKHLFFNQCVFAEGSASHAMDYVTVAADTSMATQHIKFHQCSWNGTVASATALKTVGAVDLSLFGKNLLTNFLVGINRSNSGSTFSAHNIVASNVTTFFTGSGNETQVLGARYSHPLWPSGQSSGLMGGSGSPEGTVKANNGCLYFDVDGTDTISIPRLYVKTTDSTAQNGWVAVRAGINVVAKTANYSATTADTGTMFTTTGATGAVTFTLPAVSGRAGVWYEFMNTVDQTMTVTAPANTLVAFNNATATSIAFSTASEKIGSGVRVFCDGAKWVALPILGSETATPTIS